MPSAAISGRMFLLDGTSTVAEVKNVRFSKARKMADVTSADSGEFEEFLATLKSGSVAFDINYIPTNTTHAALRTSEGSGTIKTWKLQYADTGTASDVDCTGWIESFDVSGDPKEALTASITIKLSGTITSP